MKYLFLFAFCILTQLSFAQESNYNTEKFIEGTLDTSKYKVEEFLAGKYNHLIKHPSYFEEIDKYKQAVYEREHFDQKIVMLKTKVGLANQEGETRNKLEKLFERLSNEKSSDVYTMLREPSNREFALDLNKLGLLNEFYRLDKESILVVKEVKKFEDWGESVVEILNDSPEYTAAKGLFHPKSLQKDMSSFYKNLAFQTRVYQKGNWKPETSSFLMILKRNQRNRKNFLENRDHLALNQEQKEFMIVFEKYLDENVKVQFDPNSF